MVDEDIRERHGITRADGFANVLEDHENVVLVVNDGSISKSVRLTPNEARYIASKLRRVAWRVEVRQ